MAFRPYVAINQLNSSFAILRVIVPDLGNRTVISDSLTFNGRYAELKINVLEGTAPPQDYWMGSGREISIETGEFEITVTIVFVDSNYVELSTQGPQTLTSTSLREPDDSDEGPFISLLKNETDCENGEGDYTLFSLTRIPDAQMDVVREISNSGNLITYEHIVVNGSQDLQMSCHKLDLSVDDKIEIFSKKDGNRKRRGKTSRAYSSNHPFPGA